MSTTYRVIIRRDDGTEPDHIVGTGMSERKAERVISGVLHQINLDDYHVFDEPETETDQ